MDGILPLWKERGMTSHDCIFQLRRLFRMKRIGHTGTLDPEVDGVLPVCIGGATKLIPFITDRDKTYQGEITLGIATTTEDAYGEVVDRVAVDPNPSDLALSIIDTAMKSMEGIIEQIPPMYSAVKVNGKRLYQYARQKQTVERPKRKATIYRFTRDDRPIYDPQQQTFAWHFTVVCGKGTYIRTLAVDLGKKLGYPAHMSALTRTKSGIFSAADCFTLAEVAQAVENKHLERLLLPFVSVLPDYPQIRLSKAEWQKAQHGAWIEKKAMWQHLHEPLLLMYAEKCVALYQTDSQYPTYIRPRKMLFEKGMEREQ